MQTTAAPQVTAKPRPQPRPPKAKRPSLELVHAAEISSESVRDSLPPQITLLERGLTIWHPTLFRDPATDRTRLFLARVFSVKQIKSVELDRTQDVARLTYTASARTPETVRALRAELAQPVGENATTGTSDAPAPGAATLAVEALFLETDAAHPHPVHITRVGRFLTTWNVQVQGEGKVRLSHPVLKRRKDVAYRLEEELTAVQGVREFRANVYSSSIVVRFNPRRLDVPRLMRHLEHCWPRLINGLEGPPPVTRLIASFSLLSAAFVGQYFLPVITPYVLAGMIVYSSANVFKAVKQLAQGKVGLPALYTGTITFTTLSGMPFAAAFMATWMQLWPKWSLDLLVKSQRRLFATHRQRATWARRLEPSGHISEVIIDFVQRGDLILVEEGEILPVDGVVVAGLAAIDEEALTGRAGALDKAPGDVVYAATHIRTGSITVRVDLIGVETLAGFIGENLPHGAIERLPTSAEAELVATRMVPPILALSAANLLLGGPVQVSQSTIRADYATGPRFAAQLSALHDLSDALRRGIVFRDPATLCRLPSTDIYVFDDSPALTRRQIAVGTILASRIGTTRVLSYVASAFPAFQNERARALMDECLTRRAPLLEITQRARHAGSISYVDADGDLIEIATPAFVESRKFRIPAAIADGLAAHVAQRERHRKSATGTGGGAAGAGDDRDKDPQLRPLWAIRNGAILGVITFERSGELEAVETIAVLKARNARATFVYVTAQPRAEAEVLASQLGIPTVHAGLNNAGKVDVIQSLGRRTMWIGNGSLPESRACMEAASISISVGGASTLPVDGAQIILLQPSLRGLVPLRRIGRHHRALIKEGYRTVFAGNLLCVAGAFFGGFNTLAVAFVSNFATGYVYSVHRSLLHDLIARMESKMSRQTTGTEDDGRHDSQEPEAGSVADARETELQDDYTEHDLDEVAPRDTPI